MEIPLKPWEVPLNGVNTYTNTLPYVSNTSDRLHSTAVPYPGTGGGGSIPPTTVSAAPAIPPRPGQPQSQSPQYRQLYNAAGPSGYGYTRPMMSYGSSPMYGNSYYNPYNSYSTPMGGMYGATPGRIGMYGASNTSGPMGVGDPSFSQLAEESSASAFQSIESFVSAFGSISAMLESTFHAVYSSFRAVVGVADHLGRVKQVLSTLAIFRFFRWMMRRIFYLFGLTKIKPEQIESVWNSLSQQEGSHEWENELKPGSRPSSWPILMFLGFIFAGPYLMWKLIRSLNLNNSSEMDSRWAFGETEHFIASAEFDFDASSEKELGLRKGQNIRLAPASHQPSNVKGWVLGSDGRKIGLVPINYMKILGKRSTNPVPIRTINTASISPSLPLLDSSSLLPLTQTSEHQCESTLETTTTASNDYLHLKPAILSKESDSKHE